MAAIEMTIVDPAPWQTACSAYLAAKEAVNGAPEGAARIRASTVQIEAEDVLLALPAPDPSGLLLKMELAFVDDSVPTLVQRQSLIEDARRLLAGERAPDDRAMASA